MSIEEIVEGLKKQGLDEAAAEAALKEMLDKGEITQEDFDRALELLKKAEGDEEEMLAKKLYGDDILD